MNFLNTKKLQYNLIEIQELTNFQMKKELEDYRLEMMANELKDDVLEFSFDENGKINLN